MRRSYKIKSYKRIYRRSLGSIILRWVLILGVLALLFLLGWKLYEPISRFFSGEVPPVEQGEEQNNQDEAEPEPNPIPEEGKTEENKEEPQEPAEEPEEETKPAPELAEPALRTAYFNQDLLLNSTAFSNMLNSVKAAGMDSVMIDLKSREGWVNYPISYKEGFDDYYTASETISLEDTAKQISDAGMKPIASIYTFMDRRFQQAETYAGILYGDSENFWLDDAPEAGGKSWLNPYSPLARDYICKLIDDAAEAGFTEVVLREFRFPVGGSMEQMRFVYDEGQSKLDCLKEAAEYFRKHAEEKGVHLWIEYPVEAFIGGDTRPYGGDAEELLSGNILVDMSGVQQDGLSENLSLIQNKASSAELAVLLQVSGNSDAQLQNQISVLQKAGINRYLLLY